MTENIISLTTGLASTGLAVFFMRRFVKDFDDYKKTLSDDIYKLRNSFEDPVRETRAKVDELKELVRDLKIQSKIDLSDVKIMMGELRASSEAAKMLQAALVVETERFGQKIDANQKRLLVYDNVIRKLIFEIKKLEDSQKSIQVKISEELIMLKKKP